MELYPRTKCITVFGEDHRPIIEFQVPQHCNRSGVSETTHPWLSLGWWRTTSPHLLCPTHSPSPPSSWTPQTINGISAQSAAGFFPTTIAPNASLSRPAQLSHMTQVILNSYSGVLLYFNSDASSIHNVYFPFPKTFQYLLLSRCLRLLNISRT